jgi:ribosome-associated protein
MNVVTFELRGDFIPLNALIKVTGLADSGGAAKGLVTDGNVRVNGEVETRRRCKIHAGDRVALGETEIHVVPGASTPMAATEEAAN